MPNIEEEEFSKLHKKRVGLKIALYLFLKTNETTIKEKLSALFEKTALTYISDFMGGYFITFFTKDLTFCAKVCKNLKSL